MSLEELFEEMFGDPPKKEKKDQPEKPVEESQWPRLDELPLDKEKVVYKPTGIPCDSCGIRDATHSPHYNGNWCINCWY